MQPEDVFAFGAAQGLQEFAPQGLALAQGLQGLQGIAAAQGLQGLQPIVAAQGLHGLQALLFVAAQGLLVLLAQGLVLLLLICADLAAAHGLAVESAKAGVLPKIAAAAVAMTKFFMLLWLQFFWLYLGIMLRYFFCFVNYATPLI